MVHRSCLLFLPRALPFLVGLGEFFDCPESSTTEAFQLESGFGDIWKYVAKFESGLTAAETVMVAKQLLAAHFCWK